MTESLPLKLTKSFGSIVRQLLNDRGHVSKYFGLSLSQWFTSVYTEEK